MLNFLQSSKIAMVLLSICRIALGWMWFSSGIGKVMGGEFNAGGFLQAAVDNPVLKGGGGEIVAYPLYTAFLENVAIPYADVFSFMVMWGEVLIGIALMVGLFTKTAGFFGGVMNTSFLLAGTVSTNPFMLLLVIPILVSKKNAGLLGLDSFTHKLTQWVKNKKNNKPDITIAEKPA
ncbi:DoxX family protein [Alkalicoccobacillus porphyridii]|uniref:DoxX family protein n=1 Tax=Alkalicoccobacillus porphyridii TaxID=2597270 RepID=A0A554A293_9BACI|nr:DoxX family protein [Alkalicoccobacillus porphyridii]TSB47807.1 DoxX family protein [Alkalicoccobacillus porphyridii]